MKESKQTKKTELVPSKIQDEDKNKQYAKHKSEKVSKDTNLSKKVGFNNNTKR